MSFRILAIAAMLILPACTGAKLTPTSVEKGGMEIKAGEKLTIDLQDVIALNLSNYTVTLKSITPDFANSAPLYDLTEMALANIATKPAFQFVMPKSIVGTKPLLIVVDFPEQNTQLIDVIFDGQTYVRPGIASTMTYNLAKFYNITDPLTGNIVPAKLLNQYTTSDFDGIKALIQGKIDELLATSEHLSMATTEWKKLNRYFMNGVAFNLDFLNDKFHPFGIEYTCASTTPPGLIASDTPEGSLDHYKYAKDCLIGGVPAANNPLNHLNSPAQMMPGGVVPNPGQGIFVSEGNKVSVTAQGFDIDDDFIDKDMIIQYVPRVFPSTITTRIIPEPTPSYEVISNLSIGTNQDSYQSDPIKFNEALDLNYYTVDGDTAYRNIYYIINDGMVLIPYRWNFKYADVNRQPEIVKGTDGKINDTEFDSILINPVTDTYPPIWKQHASHCETDPTALYTYTDVTGTHTDPLPYQVVRKRGDGPWTCVFKVVDKDLDDDPNAAPDIYNYTVANINPYVQAMAGDPTFGSVNPKQYIWPPVAPYTLSTPKRVQGKVLPTCVTPDGKSHYKCGVGMFQVTIDNGVKVAAETQSDLQFPYDMVVYDRDQSGGMMVSHSITRKIEFTAVPGRIINYDVPLPDLAHTHPSTQIQSRDSSGNPLFDGFGQPIMEVAGLDKIALVGGYKVYTRWDAYLSDILPQADPFSLLGGDLTRIGFDENMAGDATRARAFGAGSPTAISGYFKQPHKVPTTFDDVSTFTTGVPAGATTGAVTWLGHSLTTADISTYSFPREYDSTCNMPSNNQDLSDPTDPWDQTTVGNTGFVFELDAIDFDNVGLRIGEPTDPIYIQLAQDVQAAINLGGFMFCQYNSPNSNPLTYQTYQQIDPPAVTVTKPAVDAEACTWSAAPPNQMQPVPIYYQTTDATGSFTVKKLVYHRLRMKWMPKDQGDQPVGKTYTPPVGYLQNIVKNLNLYGNRLLLVNDTLDQTRPPVELNLFAKHKDMAPCASGMFGGTNTKLDYFHQNSPNPPSFKFSVSDENRTLGSSNANYLSSALRGRYEAELTLKGTRDIFNPDFQRLMPFISNCTRTDTAIPVPPAIAPQTGASRPAVFYTRADDPANIPRIRLTSTSVDDLTGMPATTFSNSGGMCIQHRYSPLTKGASSYNEVVIIENQAVLPSSTPYDLDVDAVMPGCTSYSSTNLLTIYPDQKYISVPSICGSSHTVNQVLWSDALTTGTVTTILNVTDYGLPVGTALNMDIFPNFYGADKVTIGSPTSTNLDLPNVIYYDIMPMDSFRIDSITKNPIYTGYTNWLTSADPANLGPNPMTNNMPSYGTQFLDWDNQPINMALAAPTPDPTLPGANVFFRGAPGDSTRIQLFIKNRAPAMFPVTASDVPIGSGLLELDPYDVKQFNLVPPTTPPAALPTFVGIGRPDCLSAPPAYPSIPTLNFTSLANYQKCNFSWTPAAADDGKKFFYSFTVQDNYNATPTVMGEGGKHPAAFPTYNGIPGDSAAKTNGPTPVFNIDIESLETNLAPLFAATSGGATLTDAYNPAGGASGWTTVYAAEAIPGQAPPASCGGPSGFGCTLSIGANNILQSTTPINLTEGTSQTFNVYAKDTNVTTQLKTISGTKPTSVLIVDGPYKGKTYTPPSFASMGWSGGGVGTATFSFTWTPTDAEANYLSNPGGFLIPVKITDQQYAAATDPSFPSQFITPALNNTIWIWAKLSVKNNSPTIYSVVGTTETPLNGLTLTMQTGSPTTVKIRVKDSDVARWTQSGVTTGYTATGGTGFYNSFLGNSGSNFITVTPAGTPYASPAPNYQFIYQDLYITGNPTNADIGSYSAPSVTFADPGDKSQGLAVNPDAASPPNAMVSAFGNSITAPFNIQVIGKPLFLVPNPLPNPAGSQVYAYSGRPFHHPLSLSISRPTELQKPFFVGIDLSTTVTPLKTTNGGGGLFVNENYVLKWLTSAFTDLIVPANRAVPLMAVVKTTCSMCTSGCNATPVAAPSKKLIRYNETTSQIETCTLTSAQVTTDASSQVANVILVDGSTTPTVPSITQTSIVRNYAPLPSPTPFATALNQQFAEFKQRCVNCTSGLTSSNATPSGLNLNWNGVSANGYAQYVANSYVSKMDFQVTPTFTVQKTYTDLAPTTVRSLNVTASKGETITFNASVGAITGVPHYRWYVNGCLKSAGLVTGANLSFSYLLNSLSAGANNDCTGEYGFAESNAGSLGKVIVRLSIVNSTQAATSASDNATVTYVYNVNVLNTDPSIQTLASYTPSAPIQMNATYLTGNQDVQFAIPVTYPTVSGKNFLAFTDASSTAGLKVRLREFNSNGDLPAAGSTLTLNCDTSLNVQPSWIGIHPHPSDGKLYISASISPASSFSPTYPVGGAAPLAYGMKNQSCFTNAITLAAPTQSYINYSSGSTVPAPYIGFSKYAMSVNSTAVYQNVGGLYAGSASDSNFFFFDGFRAAFQFWNYTISNIYGATQPEFSAPFGTNVVRKNIVSGNKNFQLIGAPANGASGWRGFIIHNTLAPAAPLSSGLISATRVNRVMFADPSDAPAPVAGDCQFRGTPLDGVYSSVDDSLYVLTYGNDASGKGHFVQISGASTASPVCTTIGDTLNPSLNATTQNPNISKMAFDSANGMVYGVINQGTGLSPQIFAFDIYTKKFTTRDLSASIYAYELIYSQPINGLFVLDNRKASTPTLYKVW